MDERNFETFEGYKVHDTYDTRRESSKFLWLAMLVGVEVKKTLSLVT